MIVGCYALDLYCERGQECPDNPYRGAWATYTSEFGSRCRQKARKHGWKLNLREGTALCPKCAESPAPLKGDAE